VLLGTGTGHAQIIEDLVLTKLSAGSLQVWSNSEHTLAILLIGCQDNSVRRFWQPVGTCETKRASA
jgi:hypothetical protein